MPSATTKMNQYIVTNFLVLVTILINGTDHIVIICDIKQIKKYNRVRYIIKLYMFLLMMPKLVL